jgi:hypothetical protein
MKTSIKFAPALCILAAVALYGLGFVSPVGMVNAEGVLEAVQAVAAQAVSTQAVSTPAKPGENDQARQCEEREVAADEGYGVSRKEVRLVCR